MSTTLQYPKTIGGACPACGSNLRLDRERKRPKPNLIASGVWACLCRGCGHMYVFDEAIGKQRNIRRDERSWFWNHPKREIGMQTQAEIVKGMWG